MKTGKQLDSNKVMGALTVLFGTGVMVESVRIYRYARSFLTGDHIVPGTAGIVLIALGLNLLFLTPAPTWRPAYPKGPILRRILGTAAIMAAYLLLIRWVGYTIGTLLASYGLFRVFGKYSKGKSAMAALLTTLFVWAVFIAWLRMPFPRGIFKYLNLPL